MRPPGPDPRITWIVDYMQRRLDEPMTVRRLASLVNLSPSRFSSLFAAQTGTSPALYLQRARLRRARLLLERTFLSVKKVMALVGYSDPSHFARDFRRAHGLAPSEIRTPSVDRPTLKRIGPPRARDPGAMVALT